MDEYERILRKAIAGLDAPDEGARYAVYERARQTILKQLQAAYPPVPETDIDARIAALYAAAKHIEEEIKGEAGPEPLRRAPVPEPEAMPAARTPRGSISALAVAGGIAAVLVAGFSAYYFVLRTPAPKVAQADPPKQAEPATPAATTAANDSTPFYLRQQRVFYRTTHPVGTVVISRNQRFLYVVLPNQTAIRYAIGVGPGCENIAGLFRVTQKVDAGGAKAPFDLPALYFDAARAVHRTSEPDRVGQATKTGCIQTWDQDIADLYNRVQLEERVVVAN